CRVGRRDADEPALPRPKLTHRWEEARKGMQRGTGRVSTENDEVHLHVGRRNERARAKEPAGITDPDRQQPFSEQRVAQPGTSSMPPTVDHVVHRDPLGATILHADLKMILQVGADTW